MKKDFNYILASTIVIISLILIIIGILTGLRLVYPELSDRALFGESTGFVGVIFSGISILLVILTLSLQIDELKKTKDIQAKQIKLTTKQILNENTKRIIEITNEISDLESKYSSRLDNRSGSIIKSRIEINKAELELLQNENQELIDISNE